MLTRLVSLPLAALLVAHAPSAAAQATVASELAELVASGGGTSRLGSSVAMDGDTVVVGAPTYTYAQEDSGAAFVYRRDHGGPGAWGEVKMLVPSDAARDDEFGISVAVSGDTVVVGAYGDDSAGSASGAAYVFERDEGGANAWGQVAKLVASDAAGRAYFGNAVAVSADTIVVGAPWAEDWDSFQGYGPGATYGPGAAYVFERYVGGAGPWVEVTKLAPNDPAHDGFGWSVGVSGDSAVVGAPWNPGGATWEGSAYVFERNLGGAGNWGEARQLVGSLFTPYVEAEFGLSVAISGDRVVVGAPKDSLSWAVYETGSAFVFERDHGGAGTWGQVAELNASDQDGGDWLGGSVAVTGDRVVVGCPGWDGPGMNFTSLDGLAFDPAANRLYATDAARGDLLTIDPATAQGTLVGALGFTDVQGLAFDPGTSTLFGTDVATDVLIHIDTVTGAGAVVGPLGFKNVRGLAFDPGTGVLFGTDLATDSLIVIDPVTGAASVVGPLGFSQVRGLAFDPGTCTLYGSQVNTTLGAPLGTAQLVTIDTATGVGIAVGYVGFAFDQVSGLAFDSTQNALKGVADDWPDLLVLIDVVTGTGSEIGEVSRAWNTGAAYAFERDQGGPGAWGETARFAAAGGKSRDWFAASLALSGNVAVSGAAYVDAPGLSLGGVQSLCYDPATGTLYGTEVFGDRLLTIDPETGTATPVGPLGFGSVQGMAWDPVTGTIYGADASTDQLIRIDPATGAGVAIGPFGFASPKQDVRALALHPTTGILYAARSPHPTGSTYKLCTIDTGTGAGTVVGDIDLGSKVHGLAFDPGTGALLGAGSGLGQLITINTTTGTGTPGPPLNFGVRALAFGAGAKQLFAADGNLGVLVQLDPSQGGGTSVGSFSHLAYAAGAAFVFELYHDHIAYCVAGTSASGCQASLSAVGIASATAPSGFELRAANVEGAMEGMFFYGASGRHAAPWGNGTSYVCVLPPVKRGGPLAGVGTLGACNGVLVQDLNARWCPTCPKPSHNPGPGTLVQAQLWYRDPFSTSNRAASLSDALEFIVTY